MSGTILYPTFSREEEEPRPHRYISLFLTFLELLSISAGVFLIGIVSRVL